MQKLTDGAGQLYNGLGTLADGTKTLHSGAQELTEGGLELRDGMRKFYEEGITKLSETIMEKVPDMLSRLRAINVMKYGSFGGITDGMEENIKFIYKTDSITAD